MIHAHQLEFKIDQLRKDKMIFALESIAIMIMAFFITVFLPQLLFQFYFANQELTAEPEVIKYIPVIAFAVAVLHFVYATVMMVMSFMKIKQYSKELEMLSAEDCCGNCGCDHEHDEHHSAWLNETSEGSDAEPMAKAMKKTAAKKKTNRK